MLFLLNWPSVNASRYNVNVWPLVLTGASNVKMKTICHISKRNIASITISCTVNEKVTNFEVYTLCDFYFVVLLVVVNWTRSFPLVAVTYVRIYQFQHYEEYITIRINSILINGEITNQINEHSHPIHNIFSIPKSTYKHIQKSRKINQN